MKEDNAIIKVAPGSLPFNQKDPWWLVRDIISPVAFMIAPQFGFVAILDSAVSTFQEASDTTPFIIVVLAVSFDDPNRISQTLLCLGFNSCNLFKGS